MCDVNENFTEYFTDTFGKRMLERSYAAIIAKTLQPQEEGLAFFNQPVSSIYTKKPIFGTVDLSIREAADKMNREKYWIFILLPLRDSIGVSWYNDWCCIAMLCTQK
mgnify:CR=1 FL=1